jgi:hypothetical protein
MIYSALLAHQAGSWVCYDRAEGATYLLRLLSSLKIPGRLCILGCLLRYTPRRPEQRRTLWSIHHPLSSNRHLFSAPVNLGTNITNPALDLLTAHYTSLLDVCSRGVCAPLVRLHGALVVGHVSTDTTNVLS